MIHADSPFYCFAIENKFYCTAIVNVNLSNNNSNNNNNNNNDEMKSTMAKKIVKMIILTEPHKHSKRFSLKQRRFIRVFFIILFCFLSLLYLIDSQCVRQWFSVPRNEWAIIRCIRMINIYWNADNNLCVDWILKRSDREEKSTKISSRMWTIWKSQFPEWLSQRNNGFFLGQLLWML